MFIRLTARLAVVFSLLLVACGAEAPHFLIERGRPAVRTMSLRWVKKLAPAMPNFLIPEMGEEHDRFFPIETAVAGFDTDKQRVFIGSSLGNLYCLDVDSGETVWRFDLEDGVGSQPLYHSDSSRVYFGAENGKFYALHARSGRLLWESALGEEIRSQAVFHDETLYVKTVRDAVYALDPENGHVIWQYRQRMVEGFSSAGSSRMAYHRGLLFTGFSNGYLAAIDPAAGEAIWTQDLASEVTATSAARRDEYSFFDIDATPAVYEDYVFAASISGGLRGMKLDSGTVTWSRPDLLNVTGLAAYDEVVYVARADFGLMALSVYDGKTIWQSRFESGVLLDPVIFDDVMFVSDTIHGLFVVSLISGELLQRLDPKEGFFARPALHAGYMLILANRGTLYSMAI